jgi:5-methylcytosine-specific restriction endonuclease McrA
MVDDQLAANPKVKALAERAMTGDVAGAAAMGLWTMAGAVVQASLSDGVVSVTDTVRLLLNHQVATELAGILVAAGLWHAAGHDCPRCPPVADGTYLFHDWFDLGYDTGEQVKTTRRKRKELKDRKIQNAVWARDCVDPQKDPRSARCRYCGTLVQRKDTRSETQPALDHVDPANKTAGVRNIVVSCRPCNQRKGQHTPAQVGMKLRPPPRPSVDDPTAPPPESATGDVSRTGERPAVAAPVDAVTGVRPAGLSDVPETAARADESGGDESVYEQPPADPPVPRTDDLKPDQNQMKSGSAVLARLRGPARSRTGLAGLGKGLGDLQGHQGGSPPGQASGSASGQGDRSRSRRRASAPQTSLTSHPPSPAHSPDPPPNPAGAPGWDAGSAPHVDSPGRFGSPYHGWRGPPASDVEESTCPVHDLPDPCRRCHAEASTDEA